MVGANGSSELYRRLSTVEARAQDNQDAIRDIRDIMTALRDSQIRIEENILSIKEQQRIYAEEIYKQLREIKETIKPFTYTSLTSARIIEGWHWADKKMHSEDAVAGDRRKSFYTLLVYALWAGLTGLAMMLWEKVKGN